jgi:hypothetical protein
MQTHLILGVKKKSHNQDSKHWVMGIKGKLYYHLRKNLYLWLKENKRLHIYQRTGDKESKTFSIIKEYYFWYFGGPKSE